MKILIGVDKVGEIELLTKAGATEFFCGYIPSDWLDIFNKKSTHANPWIQISVNKRETLYSNLDNLEALKLLIDEAKKFNSKLYLTLNALFYPEVGYEILKKLVDDVYKLGIHGLIITDIGLMHYVHQNYPNLDIIHSTCNQSLNSWSNKFFKELGVKRITFPRHITLDEMIEISNADKALEYECFVFDGRCMYDDGNCKIFHCFGFFCHDQWNYDYFKKNNIPFDYAEMQKLYSNEQYFIRWTRTFPSFNQLINGWRSVSCGLCIIPRLLKESGITSLKIAGRGFQTHEKVEMVKYINTAIDMVRNGAEEPELKDYAVTVLGLPELCDKKIRCCIPSKNIKRKGA